MAVCALFNIGVLLTNTLNMMLSQGYNIHIRSLFNFVWCRINVFVAQWIRGMASWTLVIVAFDRFQQSKTIRRAAPTQKTRRVFFTMLVTGLILIPFNLHYLFFAGSRVYLGDGTTFLACIFYKSSENKIQRILARTSTWQELVTIIIVPCILTLILNIFIIKNSFLQPVNNEHLRSRSKSRTRRVTTMLLASNIGFLALVAPAQLFIGLSYDPQRGIQSTPEEYKSFIIQGNIHQCLINTYYAASFVFCFASSSIFRREIKKLLQRTSQLKHPLNRSRTNGTFSMQENAAYRNHGRVSAVQTSTTSRSLDTGADRLFNKRRTLSVTEADQLIEQ